MPSKNNQTKIPNDLEMQKYNLEKKKFDHTIEKDNKNFKLEKRKFKIDIISSAISLLTLIVSILSIHFAFIKDQQVQEFQKELEFNKRITDKLMISIDMEDDKEIRFQLNNIEYRVESGVPKYTVLKGFPKATYVAQIYNKKIIDKSIKPTGEFIKHLKSKNTMDYQISVGIENPYLASIKDSNAKIDQYISYYFINIVDFHDNNNFYTIYYIFETAGNSDIKLVDQNILEGDKCKLLGISTIEDDFDYFKKEFSHISDN